MSLIMNAIFSRILSDLSPSHPATLKCRRGTRGAAMAGAFRAKEYRWICHCHSCFHIVPFQSISYSYKILYESLINPELSPNQVHSHHILSVVSRSHDVSGMLPGCGSSMLENDHLQIKDSWLIDELDTSKRDQQLLRSWEIEC